MNRRIHSVLAARRVIDDGDMLLYRALPAPEPAYASWRVADIPVVGLAGGQVRVIAGFAAGAEGPMKLTTATTFVVVRVEPGATMTLPVDTAAELGLYVLDGHLVAEGGMSPGQGSLALVTPGDEIALTAANDRPAKVAVIGGAPAMRPILFSGPFVMDSVEHLARAKRDYASGRMGRLDGVPF